MARTRRALNKLISALAPRPAFETFLNLWSQKSTDLESPLNLAVSCPPVSPTGTLWKRYEHHNF